MKILALEKEVPLVTEEDFHDSLLAEEARRVWELMQAEVIREAYLRKDWPGAVLVLECGTTGEAEAMLATLPLVREGLIAFELMPLGPYPGFARLFRDE
jgi:hypothetical protein